MKAHLGNQQVQVLEKSKNWWTNKFFENAGWTQNEDGAWTGRSSLLVSRYGTSTGGFFGSGMNITQQITISFIAKYDPVSPTAAVGMIIRVNYTDGSRTDKYIDTTEYSKYIVTSTYGKVIDSIVCAYGQGDNIIYFKDVQIELGATATEYEPYIRRFNFHSPVNLIKMPYDNGLSKTTNGITFRVDEKTGWVTANGTSTGLASFYMKDRSWSMVANESVVRGKFLLKGCPPGGNYTNTYFITVSFSNADDKRIYLYSHQTNGVLEVGDGRKYTQAYITIRPNVTVDNLVFKPELIKLLGD